MSNSRKIKTVFWVEWRVYCVTRMKYIVYLEFKSAASEAGDNGDDGVNCVCVYLWYNKSVIFLIFYSRENIKD